jgi:endonuclease/exonuclease/phosphatase family metal-dependent hydrolase
MKIIFAILAIFNINTFNLSIATYNIRNFDHDHRMGQTDYVKLKQSLIELDVDLIAVQEIRMKNKFNQLIHSTLFNYKTVFSACGGAHTQYLGFVYNTKKLKLENFITDSRTSNPNTDNASSADCNRGSRPLAIGFFKVLNHSKSFIAINTHLKSGNNPQIRAKQLNLIKSVVKKYRKQGHRNFILLGDFNTTYFNTLNSNHRKTFMKFTTKTQTINTAKDLACTSYWYGGVNDGLFYPSHLDHILVSKGLFKNKVNKATVSSHCKTVSCKVVPRLSLGKSYEKVSDHCPIKVQL